jgi:hypothetical protein
MFSNTTEYNVAIRSFGRSRIVVGLVIAFSSAANAAPPAPLPAAMAQPLLFEPNVGQTDARAHWVARGPGYQLFFTDDSVMMTLLNPVKHAEPPGLLLRPHAPPAKIQDLEPSVVRLRINGSHRWTNATGLAPVTSVTNYLIGNDRSKWHTNVANFTQLKENHIYDGVDIVFYGNGANLEYDFIVAPGADPAQIHLAFDGIDRMRIEKNGDLCLTLSSGKELKQLRPRIYQQIGEQRLEVTGNYKILDRENVTFALAR